MSAAAHHGVLWSRRVTLDGHGRVTACAVEFHDQAHRARCDDVAILAITKTDIRSGLVFATWPGGEPVVIRSRARLVEGQKIEVRIAAEAYADKSARAVILSESPSPAVGVTKKSEGLPRSDEAWTHAHEQGFGEVVELCRSGRVEMAGAGRLHLTVGQALTAIDVDTGHMALSPEKQLPHVFAGVARAIILTGLRGLFALDLPLVSSRTGYRQKLREQLVAALREGTVEKITADPIGPSGVCVFSVAHGTQPLWHQLCLRDGALRQRVEVAMALDAVEAALIAERSRSFALCFAPRHHAYVADRLANWQEKLCAIYGARAELTCAPGPEFENFEIREMPR
jgi:hypothetical protein